MSDSTELLDRIVQAVVDGEERIAITPEEYHELMHSDVETLDRYFGAHLPSDLHGKGISIVIVNKPDLRTIPVTVSVDMSTGEVHEDPPTGVRHLPSPGHVS